MQFGVPLTVGSTFKSSQRNLDFRRVLYRLQDTSLLRPRLHYPSRVQKAISSLQPLVICQMPEHQWDNDHIDTPLQAADHMTSRNTSLCTNLHSFLRGRRRIMRPLVTGRDTACLWLPLDFHRFHQRSKRLHSQRVV
jgi:hypothetical protein